MALHELKNLPFSANQKPFLIALQSNPFPPSIFHFHPAITYCPPKDTAILFISALTPYAVTPEPCTDSKPLRRHFAGKTGFETSRRKTLQTHFRQSFESWVAGLRPACFLVTFCTMQKVTIRFPFGKLEVLQTSIQLAAMASSLKQN